MSAHAQRIMTVFAALAIGLAGAAHAGNPGIYTSGQNGFDTHTSDDDGEAVTVFDTQFTPPLARERRDAAPATARHGALARPAIRRPAGQRYPSSSSRATSPRASRASCTPISRLSPTR